MRDRLAALLAFLFLASGLAVVFAGPAHAAEVPGPPTAANVWGFCNVRAALLTTGGSKHYLVDWACQLAPSVSATFGQTTDYDSLLLSLPTQTFQGLARNGGVTNACGDSTYVTTHQSVVVDSIGHVRFTYICATGSGSPSATGASTLTNLGGGTSGGACVNTYCAYYQKPYTGPGRIVAGTVQTYPDDTNFAAPPMPTSWLTGGGPEVTAAACTFTSDLPTGGVLTAGQAVHITVTYADGSTAPATLPMSTVSQIGTVLGEFATPTGPYPPAPVWVNTTRTTSPQVITMVAPHAGPFNVSARCDFADGQRITAGTGGPSTTDFCAANPTVTGCQTSSTRPSLSDCLPSTDGGLFGILGTVLDPQTYVKATACLAEALFMPGPTTTAALQSLWTLAQSRAPFSYLHDAVTFLPSALTSFSSGLAGNTGGCLINIPGAGCASISTSSDLALVRSVLLFLFVGLLTLAVIRTTMRVANGG